MTTEAKDKTDRRIETDSNEYARIHQILKREYGKASKCENTECLCLNPKRFEWALRHGREYSINREDYVQLCSSCHRKYDYTDAQKAKLSRAKIGNKNATRRRVLQYDCSGELINSFESVSAAAKITGTNRTSISECLAGEYKTANGFIWK